MPYASAPFIDARPSCSAKTEWVVRTTSFNQADASGSLAAGWQRVSIKKRSGLFHVLVPTWHGCLLTNPTHKRGPRTNPLSQQPADYVFDQESLQALGPSDRLKRSHFAVVFLGFHYTVRPFVMRNLTPKKAFAFSMLSLRPMDQMELRQALYSLSVISSLRSLHFLQPHEESQQHPEIQRRESTSRSFPGQEMGTSDPRIRSQDIWNR